MKTEQIAQELSETCLCRRSRALARTVTRAYDDALREFGLTAGQLTILAAVVRNRGISQVQLGDALAMEKSTVSRTVRRMAKQGWLDLTTSEGEILDTPEGRKLLRRSYPRWAKVQQEMARKLGGDTVASLLAS